MNQYDSIVKSIQLSQREQEIISAVREGIASDTASSPFFSDKWYKKFTPCNLDGISLGDAPLNAPLMVVSESLGTFYRNDRGQGVSRGSVIVRLSSTTVFCLDASYWYASPSGSAIVYAVDGYFEYALGNLYGLVKPVSLVNLP